MLGVGKVWGSLRGRQRAGLLLCLMVGAVSATGCAILAIPLGIEYREMYVSKIDAPQRAKKGEVVTVVLHNPVTPQGSAQVSTRVDDARRSVMFVVTEADPIGLIGGAYPQMVVTRELHATFTPQSTGVYRLHTRGGVAEATIEVEE